MAKTLHVRVKTLVISLLKLINNNYPLTYFLVIMMRILQFNITYLYLFLSILLTPYNIVAQETDSINNTKQTIKLSGFIDVFYAYDFNKPSTGVRQSFLYNHNRHNEFNLNLGLIQLAVEAPKYRANLALQTGVYANDNYAAEPGVLKNIFEANVGVSLNKKNNLWLDVGILPSHIGFESAISGDNWTLTRSLLAENSPYFETGAKLTYTSENKKWFVSGLVLNGWQCIQRLEGNSLLAVGHQLTYKPAPKITINSSSFIGTDTPDSTRQMRYFHDLYAVMEFTERFGLIAGFDIGVQQKSKNSSEYNVWYSSAMIARYKFTDTISMAARVEYYSDKEGVIISTENPNGFQTWASSLNFDYHIMPNAVWRIEGRRLWSKDEVFSSDRENSTQNYTIISSLALTF